jgi:hypothetical protein
MALVMALLDNPGDGIGDGFVGQSWWSVAAETPRERNLAITSRWWLRCWPFARPVTSQVAIMLSCRISVVPIEKLVNFAPIEVLP